MGPRPTQHHHGNLWRHFQWRLGGRGRARLLVGRIHCDADRKGWSRFPRLCIRRYLQRTERQQQYGALLDSFLQDVPGVLNDLVNAEEDYSSTVNGIFSVLFGICQKVPTNDRPAYWSKLAEMVTSDTGSAQKRLQLLLNTFNAIAPTETRARYAVFCIIIDFAANNELVAVLAPQLGSVEARTSGWGLNTNERRELHMKLASALKGAGDSSLTFKFIVKYLTLFEEGDDMQAAFPLAVEASVIAIQDPVHHDCAELLRLPAVAA